MKMNWLAGAILPLLLAGSVWAAPKVHPVGNPAAPKGGSFVVGLGTYPKALLYYLGFDEFSLAINGLILEPMIENHPESNELIPRLASDWTVSPDHRLFTFKLNPAAKFSDGSAVTSDDVKFTWDTVMNPKNKTVPFQSAFASFESCTVIDPLTVQFKARTLHFKNLDKFTDFLILPRKFFSEGDFNKAFHSKMLGSGPYLLDEVTQGEKIVVKRNPAYWGAGLPQNIGRYNFDRIVFKAVPDMDVQFELFKKGDIDFFYFLISKMWATETDGPVFSKGYVKKLKAESHISYGMQGLVWNLRRPLFQDRKVRLALAHLMNRERYIKDFFYSNYVMSTGTLNVNSVYSSPKNKALVYDPKKARDLLREAGWTKVGSDGVLTKDGQRFEFEMLIDNPSLQRFLTIYQEDLKQMGVKMTIRTVDWTTSIKLRDDWQFDATLVARSQDVDPSDFAVLWGSKDADTKGSANNTGYKNPEIDKLAQQIDETFDKAKRIPLVRHLDEILARDQPMAFTWEQTYLRLGYWNRIGFPGKGYFNYSHWRDVYEYWWYDAEKDAKLKKAVQAGEPLS